MKLSLILLLIGVALEANCHGEAVFLAGTFNLDNYVVELDLKREMKPPVARAQVRESILAMKADVLALQEVGSPASLKELLSSLKQAGLDYPYWEFALGHDTNSAVAILSRFPISARRSSTNLSYLLNGRRFYVSRAFAEADIDLHPRYKLTAINVHLKSRRTVAEGDENELRMQEAACLREIIDQRLKTNPQINLMVMGDLNDTPDAPSTRMIIGKSPRRLVDIQPAEPTSINPAQVDSRLPIRKVNWTYYYARADTFSRIDYILLSPGLFKEWLRDRSFVVALPNWGIASDHRPIIASFAIQER